MEEPLDSSATTLTAEVAAVRFRLDGGDFAVLIGLTDGGDEVVLTGPLAHLHEGETVEVGGGWRRHAKHGWQFHCERVRVGAPASEHAILSYLGSVKHVGPRGAAWLLERHGPEYVLEAIDQDPGGRLREVPGIGPRRLPAAVRSWEQQGAQRAVRLFLEEHGVPAAAAGRVVRAFGSASIELLRSDPYAITAVDGIGFATADALAQALGAPADSPGRLEAGLLHVLTAAEADGHCHLPRAELLARAAALLGLEPATLGERLDAMAAGGRVVMDGDRVLDERMDATERALGRRVAELLAAPSCLDLDVPDAPPSGERAPTPAQWAAIRVVAQHRLSILTGLPGTGKTATMRALVELTRAQHRRVRLCAPTGKAARRLAETTGVDATTIHRMLEWQPGEGFARGAEDPIPGTDLLIVDEASMLDVRLAGALFEAVGPRTHVLLVGDVDQLAPVGPGRVLEDLIESGAVPATRLTEIFRQAARSLIVRAAHAINRGERPPTEAAEGDLRDFFFVRRDGPGALFDEVVALAAERLPRHYAIDPVADLQVLSPMHRGPVGIDAFNTALRERLNPAGAQIPGTPFRIGDRVLQHRNNHERELMNGEGGVLVSHDDDRDTVLLSCADGRILRLGLAETDTLRLAYCTSVHKMQGSQAPVIVVVLHRGHHMMLTRSLIYTAITRAERACVVVGEPQALAVAVRTLDARRRYTRLAELVG